MKSHIYLNATKERVLIPPQKELLLPIFLIFIILVPSSFSLSINSVSLYLIIPGLFIYRIITAGSLFFKFRFFAFFILLIYWMLIGGFAAKNSILFWSEMKKMLGVLMFSFLLISFSWRKPKFIFYLYILYIFKFIFIFFYAYQNRLFSTDFTSERFNLPDLNGNTFGYYGFFALISSAFLIDFIRKRNKLFITFCLILIFGLMMVAGVFTASRATILIGFVTFFLILIVQFLYPFSRRTLYHLFLISIPTIIFSFYFKNIFNNSLLKTRLDKSHDARIDILKRAGEVGYNHPYFGVGAGNFILYNKYHAFSHSTYAELWANNGLLGLLIFILIFVDYFLNVRRIYKRGNRNRIVLYFFLFGIMYCIYNFFYVFYLEPYMLGFFFLVRIHLELVKSRRI